jgi:uncharacterized protein (TIGR02145 family)
MKEAILFLYGNSNEYLTIKIISVSANILIKKASSKYLFSLGIIAWIAILLLACENLDINRVIKIETDSVFNITSNSAKVTSEIIDLGETEITDYGHCWSTVENPTITLETRDTLGKLNLRGEYTSRLSALIRDTTYYVRAYATDKQGTVYGDQFIFNTINTSGSYIDNRDGRKYKWVEIGNQVWMAENLAYLPAVVPPASSSQYVPYYYVYDYNGISISDAKATGNYGTYGVLYNWLAAMNTEEGSITNPSGVKGICPMGWHLPSDAEWAELIDYLGDASVAGGKLKESGYSHWQSPNIEATNSSGFTALPGGFIRIEGSCNVAGYSGLWWSATENGASYSFYYLIDYNRADVIRAYYNKPGGFSVRCVRDN